MNVTFTAIYLGSGGFVCALALLALSGPLRERFRTVFSLPPPANQSVVKPFDSIRGLAALWVALFHAWQWLRPANDPGTHFLIEQGHLAVPLFVSISAFLIYRSLKPIGSAGELLGYFKRRWLRVYPLYFVTTAVVFACGYVGGGQLGVRRIVAEFLMLRLFGYSAIANPPAWSLYVEEGFYLFVPLWFWAFRRRAAWGAAASYAALCAAGAVWPARELDLVRYFCVGILLAETIGRGEGIQESVKWAVLLVGLGLGFITVASLTGGKPYYYFYFPETVTRQMFAAGVFCALWGAVNVAPVHAFLSAYPPRFLGIISYSVYMWHGVLIVTGTPLTFYGVGGVAPAGLASAGVTAPVHGPAAFFLLYGSAFIFYSAVSYALIEYPFLLLRRRTIAK